MSGTAFNQSSRRAKVRSSSGMLALTLGVTVLLVVVGLSVCGLIGFLAGFRELQNATDSAALSVGKEQIKLNVALKPGLEKENFSALVDNGNVDLLNYNRIIGQLILVSLNAESERSAGSAGAMSHANQLWSAVQGGNESISERLAERLKDSSSASMPFSGILGSSNLRMLSSQGLSYCGGRYNVAYINEGDSTNVFLDDSQIPKGTEFSSDFLSAPKGKLGHRFFRGYKPINIANSFTIEGTPVMPGRSPHLVSSGTFAKHVTQPLAVGVVPPNCFQSACQLEKKDARVSFDACAVVGSLQSEYPASIPGGYVEVDNGSGSSDTIMELIDKAGLEAPDKVVPQLVQRLRQIQPSLSDDGAVDYLNNVRVDAGKRIFLCLDDQSQQLKAVPTIPPNYVSGTIADGTDQVMGQNAAASLTYTPSSGYNNLLAVLKLKDAPKPAESKAELAEAAEERAAKRLLEIEKERTAAAQAKAAADELKIKLALDRAQAEEERIKSDMAQAQNEEQKAAAAAQKAASDEQAANKALQLARTDAAKAHSDKDNAAALDRAAAAKRQEAQAAEQKANQQKVLSELANQKAQNNMQLAQTERQRMLKDMQLAQLTQAREAQDLRASKMSDQKSGKS